MTRLADGLQMVRGSWRILLKELSAFGIVGAVNSVIDVAIYQLMYATLNQGALLSKVVSTAVTATLAYFMHRHWSFSHRARTGLRREYLLFILLSVVSLLMGLLVIGAVRYGLGRTDVLALQVANVTSILVGAVFRFWVYKRWVFPPKLLEEDLANGRASYRSPASAAEPRSLGCTDQ